MGKVGEAEAPNRSQSSMFNENMQRSSVSPRIRIAEMSDVAGLVPMINAAFAVETFFDGTRTDETRLAAMMNKGTILVAEDADGELLASVYLEPRGARGYLGMLAVDTAQQGRGLGRLMMEAGEEHFRRMGCEAVDITVLNLRTELPPLYRKLGYVDTGTEEFHPSAPLKPGVECHGIVMSKKL
jgi:ribosomal protein S18 acetylase RimI-like enzyme